MTLSRQLVLLILTLMTMVFVGAFIISLGNTRDYLETQLESHAQDAATSLGLSITTHLTTEDMASVTAMVDAIFDRGFYRKVVVENALGKVQVERKLSLDIEEVPDWFVNAISLRPPQGEALVMSGWKQAGRVKVVSHPGFAYEQLWTSAIETFWWFLVSTLVLGGAGIFLLKIVLKPLRTVEWQADSICNREFPQVQALPKTPDLRRIVVAMNRMTEKVQMMLAELERMANRFREQAHQHPVTGLANRRFFTDTLSHQIDSDEEFLQGALFMVQLKDFKAFNDRHGFSAGDELLKETTGVLKRLSEAIPRHTLAHLSGADFALLAEDITRSDAERLAQQLTEELSQVIGEGREDMSDVGHVGAVYYAADQSLSELLSNADMALRNAQSQGPNAWHLLTPDAAKKVRMGSQWKDFIESALSEGRVLLQFQPVISCDSNRIMHREVFVRLRDDKAEDPAKSLLTAGLFMPMAERFGLTSAIDQVVITKVLDYLEANPESGILAVNVSPPSLRSESFIGWLDQTLEASSESDRIVLELAEYGAVAMLGELQGLIARLGAHGTGLALDHFGRGFASFAYLRSLKVDYLKIDGSYIRQLDDRDHEFFIQTLAEIAHSLDVQVIAESVESEETWHRLGVLSIDGGQGYFLGRPE